DQFNKVLSVLRDGLAATVDSASEQSAKTEAVKDCFLTAVAQWPDANPSDLWYFVTYRMYLDRYLHPARFARMDLGQSWKRTAGWALERILVAHYGPFLKARGVELEIPSGERKSQLLAQLEIDGRLEEDKVDVVLVGRDGSEEVCFGVVHVKASFAERRTDDVPLSAALVRAGYTSPLWTLDAKATPSAAPVNRGELGVALSGDADRRSAKRKDIEDDGFFSACFSYNANTIPTPDYQNAEARVVVCDFKD